VAAQGRRLKQAQLKRPQAWRKQVQTKKHFQTNDCFHKWSTLHATSALIVKLTVDYLLALCLWMKNNQQSFENNQTLNTSGLIHETQEQIQFCVKTFLQTFQFTSNYEDFYISPASLKCSLQLYYPAFTFFTFKMSFIYIYKYCVILHLSQTFNLKWWKSIIKTLFLDLTTLLICS